MQAERMGELDAEIAETRKARREYLWVDLQADKSGSAFSQVGTEPTRRSFARGAGSYAIRCRTLFSQENDF